MKIDRRTLLPLLMSAATPLPLSAQPGWPQRGVRLITSSQPGGSPDLVARVYGEALAALWGQSVITENRPGADGGLAVAGLREAATSDAPVLLVAPANTLTVTPVLREKPPFDPSDAQPVALAAADFLAIAVPSDSPVHNLDELVRAAQNEPGKLNWFAVPGGPFMVFSDWMQRRRVQMTFISYRGAPDAVRDLGENRIQAVMAPLVPLLPLVAAGKVRLIAVSNPDRSPLAAQVVTVEQAGHPELALEGAIAFFAPRNLTREYRQKIAGDIAMVARDQRVSERLRNSGQVAKVSTPEELERSMTESGERWRRLAQSLQIKPS